MNVLIEAIVLNAGKIEVDDVHHIANIQASSRYTGGNHDGSCTCAEGTTGKDE